MIIIKGGIVNFYRDQKPNSNLQGSLLQKWIINSKIKIQDHQEGLKSMIKIDGWNSVPGLISPTFKCFIINNFNFKVER